MPPVTIRKRNGALGPATQATGRQTEPAYFSPYGINNIGVVPRRGLDARSRAFLTGKDNTDPRCLGDFAKTFPLRLLRLLKDVHPLISQAWLNNQALAFAPGDTRFVALKDLKDDQGKPVVDDEGTQLLDDLWKRCGGLEALQQAAGDQVMTEGLVCIEAVPGPLGMGVWDLFTFDSLSVQFRIGKPEQDEPPLVAQQRQGGQWVDLPDETCWCRGFHGTRDNPYGRPMFSAVLTEGLEDIRTERNLGDALHSVAWPRYWASIALKELIQYATENHVTLGLLPPNAQPTDDGRLTPVQWAHQQVEWFKELMEGIKAAETLIRADGGQIGVLNAGAGLADIHETLMMRRHRLVMGVCQPPTLLGIDTGGTKAYSSTQWVVYAVIITLLRAFVNAILLEVAELHLQLLGKDLAARADVTPIRTEDMLREAQAEAQRLANEERKITDGFTTAEEGCVAITGSGLADPDKAAKIGAQPAALLTDEEDDTEETDQDTQGGGGQRKRRQGRSSDAQVQAIHSGMLARARERRRQQETVRQR